MSSESGFSVPKWLVVVAIVGGSGFFSYRHFNKPAAEPIVYRSEPVTRGDLVQSVTANGSLVPVRLVEVGSQISGVITELKADFNTRVKAGDVIAQIDPATYERAVVQAEAEMANAEAGLELSKLEYERASELFANALISKAENDQARVRLLQAEATVKTRLANLDRAKVDLSRTTIYAPMDGIIISRQVESGQTVAASMNTPTLFVLANDLAKMRIEAAVSEADIGGVEEGQTVQFDVDAFPGRKFPGFVDQVRYAASTNQSVITYTTVVSVDNEDLKLRPGMTANARIITSERRGALKIPNAALRFRPPEGAIVKTDAAAESAEPAPVKLMESGPFAGLPEIPWMAGGNFRRPTDSERAAYEKSLTPEQKAQYDRISAQMRANFAQGGAGGAGGPGGFRGGPGAGGGGRPGGAPRASQSDGPTTGSVYVIETASDPNGKESTTLRQVTVKLGVTDGASTELLEGLNEGDVVASGIVATEVAADNLRNPFSPFGRRPGR